MIEEIIAIWSVVGEAISIVNTGFEIGDLHNRISGIAQDDASQHGLKKIANELEALNIKIERLSKHIMYAPDLEAFPNPTQQSFMNSEQMKASLSSIQRALGRNILSSRPNSTPKKLREAMSRDPLSVFVNPRPIRHTGPPPDPTLVGVLFKHKGITYKGWTPRGSLPAIYGCEYNELWLPKTNTKKSIRQFRPILGGKLVPGYEDNISHKIKPNIYKKISSWYSQRTGRKVQQILNSGKYVDKHGNIVYKYTVYPSLLLPPFRKPSFRKNINLLGTRKPSFRKNINLLGARKPSFKENINPFNAASSPFVFGAQRINSYTTKDNKILASYFNPLSNSWSKWYEI